MSAVEVFEGGMGFEVHVDPDERLFSVVDAEQEREWSNLTYEEVCGLLDAITAAVAAHGEGDQ